MESKFALNPAISIEINSKRSYVNGLYFSHVLGYLGKINSEELEVHPDYFIDDYIGKTGLELYYEDILRGSYGERLIEVDSRGKIENIFARKEPESGEDMVLSIDGALQQKLYDEIRIGLGATRTSRAARDCFRPKYRRNIGLG